MIRSFFQACLVSGVALSLSSCALLQTPARMLQAVGRTFRLAGSQDAATPRLQLEQREIDQNRAPLRLEPLPGQGKAETRLAAEQPAPAVTADRS